MRGVVKTSIRNQFFKELFISISGNYNIILPSQIHRIIRSSLGNGYANGIQWRKHGLCKPIYHIPDVGCYDGCDPGSNGGFICLPSCP